MWLGVAVAAVAAVMIGVFYLGGGNKPPAETPSTKTNAGTKHADQGQEHITNGAAHEPYNSDLPSSGPHYTSPAPWGVKEQELADETLIHNMEHGGIVIAYKPDLPKAQIDKLKNLFNTLPRSQQFGSIKAIVVPRAKNSNAVQLAAWTYTLNLDNVDEKQIIEFYKSHLDKGPELVP
ncbi:MAG TPA: DUF3105 domain-containing protein [Candidatus Dormibacteraeota bacterium]|nr:DUF3105 domain-containing protein [Candidatus Dormibacteraeota bacterium]